MEPIHYLQSYSDQIQIVRGIYLLSELPGSNFASLGNYLIQKIRSEDRLSFYYEFVNSVGHKSEFSSLAMPSQEEVTIWDHRIKEISDNKEFKISQSKNAGLRDSYRVHVLELARFYYKSGDMAQTMKVLQRAKDLTVTAEQQYELFSLTALASLFKKNISFAQNNAQKVIMLNGITDDQTLTARVIMGICYMDNNNYKSACEYFLALDGKNNGELASNTDLAVYTALCALASMDRQNIRHDVSQSRSFLILSEDEKDLTDLMDCYLNCKFGRAMMIVEAYRKRYSSDYFIGKIVPNLCDEIRNRCLVQYLKAFKRVSIQELATNFEMSEKNIEEKVSKLITNGKVDARIDAHQKIVKARQVDQKNKINRQVLNTAKDFIKNSQLILLKMSMIQEEVIVKGIR